MERERRDCPVCPTKGLLRLPNHLRDMHNLSIRDVLSDNYSDDDDDDDVSDQADIDNDDDDSDQTESEIDISDNNYDGDDSDIDVSDDNDDESDQAESDDDGADDCVVPLRVLTWLLRALGQLLAG